MQIKPENIEHMQINHAKLIYNVDIYFVNTVTIVSQKNIKIPKHTKTPGTQNKSSEHECDSDHSDYCMNESLDSDDVMDLIQDMEHDSDTTNNNTHNYNNEIDNSSDNESKDSDDIMEFVNDMEADFDCGDSDDTNKLLKCCTKYSVFIQYIFFRMNVVYKSVLNSMKANIICG